MKWIWAVAMFLLQKIKELTYMHSEGILSGELKHGPLAMIDQDMPCIMIIMKDNTYSVSCSYSYQQRMPFGGLNYELLVQFFTLVSTWGRKRACYSNTGVMDGIVPHVAKNSISG